MARTYKPASGRMTRVAVKLLIPTATRYNGVNRYSYPADGDLVYVSWKSYGGTESIVDGVYSVIDTASLTMRYRPDVKSACRILRADGVIYEIKGEPENVDLANQWLICKVERVKGGA